MKAGIIKRIAAGLCMVVMAFSVAACGKTDSESTEQTTEAVQEETTEAAEQTEDTQAAEDGEEEIDFEAEVQAVQNSLTYMGGLKSADGSDKAIDFAIFRNEDGEVIYIYRDDQIFDYGMFTTEDAKTDDDKEYTKIKGTMGEYGYHFNEELVSGMIIDSEGKAYDAVELDEDGSRELVRNTLGG